METIGMKIIGKVQGVFFRQTAKEQADKLGIKGTVKNCDDEDAVEIVATGPKEQLDKFVEWCRQGPPRAEVAAVETKNLALQHFGKFSILHY